MQSTGEQIGLTYNWSKKHILLIDSDWLNFDLHQLHFKQTASLLSFAKNFQEATRLYYEYPIDIIITELYFLNEEDQHFLKNTVNKEHIPIIIQTTQILDSSELKKLGFEYEQLFLKPIHWSSYMSKLDPYLKTHLSHQDLESPKLTTEQFTIVKSQ